MIKMNKITETQSSEFLEIDKNKICDWIMHMDVDDFYDLCCALSDQFEFTGEQLFYSCSECGNEHGDICEYHSDACKYFFVEHYK